MLFAALSLTLISASQNLAASAPAEPSAALTVKQIRTSHGIKLMSVAPGPTGSKVVVGAEDKTVQIVDASSGATLKTFVGHPQPCYAVAWSPDGKLIASGDESARIFVWDVATGKKLRELRTHQRGIQALSFNPSSKFLMSTGKDDMVRVYDLSSGKEVKTIAGKGTNLYGAHYLSNGGTLVATLGAGAKLTVGSKETTFNYPGNQGYWEAAYVSQSSRVLTAARDGKVVVWDAKTGKRLQFLNGHQDWAIHVVVTPNGKYAVSSSADQTVRVWDLKTMANVATLTDQSFVGAPICITADGKFLVSATSSESMLVSAFSPAQGEPAKKGK